jgi:hypothetical protein
MTLTFIHFRYRQHSRVPLWIHKLAKRAESQTSGNVYRNNENNSAHATTCVRIDIDCSNHIILEQLIVTHLVMNYTTSV